MAVPKLVPLALCALGAFGCKDDIVGTGPRDPRQYTWRIDTLSLMEGGTGNTELTTVWGFSPTDVYVGGSTSGHHGKLWHFNGSTWEPVKLLVEEGGTLNNIGDIEDLHGLPDGTLFAAGETASLDAFMLMFYHSYWLDVSPDSSRLLQSVFANDPSDVWVGGIQGDLFHFNGSYRFTRSRLPLDIPPDANPLYNCYSITGVVGRPSVLLLYAPTQVERYYLFEFADTSWTQLDSVLNEYRRRVWYSPEGTLYCIGDGVHRRSGTSWEMTLADFRAFGICGTSDRDLFVVGRRGFDARVYHYNGADWYLYSQIETPNATYYDCWSDGTTVFAVGVLNEYPRRSVVIQGR